MVEQIIARDQYELMQILAKVIKHEDFPAHGMSYFRIHACEDDIYRLVYSGDIYEDEWIFMEQISSQIPYGEMFAFVSFLDGEITFGFRGVAFFGEYEHKNNRWELRDYEDYMTRDRSWAEQRLELSSAEEELKKALS